MVLADELVGAFPSIERLRDDLSLLTPYSVAARYPDDDADIPSLEDAREARQCAERIVAWVRETSPDLVH